jgi:cytochrome c oxidase assembly protein subunit 15
VKPSATYDRPLNLLAWCVAVATFPLIWVGGLVTTTNAGMAVPDWPGTYGYNLFAYPWQTWIFGPWDLFVEHGHRLLASGIGLLTIALLVTALVRSKQPEVRWGAAGLLALVILQGVLGGARVVFDKRQVALVHGCVGPMFFLSAVAFAVYTSAWWNQAQQTLAKIQPLFKISLAMLAALVAQLVFGAFVRHVDVESSPAHFRGVVYFHLVTAGLIVLLAGVVLYRAQGPAVPLHMKYAAMLLAGLVVLQIALGVGSWVVRYSWPDFMERFAFAAQHVSEVNSLWGSIVRTAHVANGSALLAVAGYLTLHGYRLTPRERSLQLPTQQLQGVAL